MIPPKLTTKADLEGHWAFVIALPSAWIAQSVRAGPLALVSDSDLSGISLLERQRVCDYLGRFQTPFRKPLFPSVVVARPGHRPSTNDIADLRNVVAVAATTLSRTEKSVHPNIPTGALFTDAYDFARITLRAGARGLLVDTPAVTSFGGTEEAFAGQGSPLFPYVESLRPAELDSQLVPALVAALMARPHRRSQRMQRARLLRSLEMAAHAMRAPSYGFNSDTDHGVLLSLWVAAFETLANPADRVGFREVRTAIDSVPWLDSRLRTAAVRHDRRSPSARLDDIRRVSTRAGSTREALGRAKRGVLLTRPAQVYSRLYRARNVTMHGEELSRGGLEPGRRPNWGYLDLQAAALYRCVLLHAAETAGHGTYLRPSVPTAVSLHEDEVLSRMSAYHEAEMAHEIYELALRNERPFH